MDKYIYKSIFEKCDTDLQEVGAFSALEDSDTKDIGIDKLCCLLSKQIYKYNENNLSDFETHCVTETGLVYGIFYINKTDAVVVFKGTSSIGDWASNVKLVKTDDFYNIPGKFHDGFHDMLLGTREVERIYNKLKLSVTKVYITGHSLGGALATIFYSYCKKCDIDAELVTFGSPRVGDKEFAEYLNSGNPEKMRRYVNGSDVVCRIPYLGYHHVNTKILLGKSCFIPSVKDHSISAYLENL